MADILTFATSHLRSNIRLSDYEDLVTAVRVINAMCAAQGLKILMLQSFTNFEGWPTGSPEREQTFERVRGWIDMMKACGTDMLQVRR
jgi:hypothetical protein